jgi:hypothetical protein
MNAFTTVPDEIVLLVLCRLGVRDLLAAARVDRRFARIAGDSSLWRCPGDPACDYADLGCLSTAAAARYGPLIHTYHLRSSNRHQLSYIEPTTIVVYPGQPPVHRMPSVRNLVVVAGPPNEDFLPVFLDVDGDWAASVAKSFPDAERLEVVGDHGIGPELRMLVESMPRLDELVFPSYDADNAWLVSNIHRIVPAMTVATVSSTVTFRRRQP